MKYIGSYIEQLGKSDTTLLSDSFHRCGLSMYYIDVHLEYWPFSRFTFTFLLGGIFASGWTMIAFAGFWILY